MTRCQALLGNLKPENLTSRFDQVEEACSQTFEWLFEKPELGFQTWLESSTGLYWCRGYPASGKSTLMKWALQDSRTHLASTQDTVKQAHVKFFFRNRGIESQKSFIGLLHSIIYQILQELQELIPLILPL